MQMREGWHGAVLALAMFVVAMLIIAVMKLVFG